MLDKRSKRLPEGLAIEAHSSAGVEFGSVADIPYLHRQRILVVADDVAQLSRPLVEEANHLVNQSFINRVRRRGKDITDQTVASTVRAVAKMRAHDADVLLISRSEAAGFDFKPSHPHSRTVYVAHPIITTQYFDAAHFHEHLLEGRFAELLRLLTALGATTINIEQIEGKQSDSLVNAILGGVGFEGGAKKRKALFKRSHAMWSGTLPGHRKPELPEGELAWYPTEPFWQHIAEARIKYNQQDFNLLLRHDQSMGITADLKVALKGANLEAGGELQEHEAVAWNISGHFL